MKRNSDHAPSAGTNRPGIRALAALLAVLMTFSVLSGCSKQEKPEQDTQITEQLPPEVEANDENAESATPVVEARARLSLLDFSSLLGNSVTPSVPDYQVASDLSNVVNLDQFYLSDAQKAKLAENQFVVTSSYRVHYFFSSNFSGL